ncbi:MAG: hypothetical protein CSA58_01065 [Micrococcales bacterium]|nr:MAG: hypothetical protein CSA58_01065 [Micrococcales bacterium]
MLQADMAQQADVDRMLDQTIERFGRVDGVLHAAGLAHLMYLPELTSDIVEGEFASKVYGLRHLDQSIARLSRNGQAPGFVLVFSSIAAILGGLAMGAYAPANRFMDAFVQAGPTRAGTDWITVNFDDWDFDYDTEQVAAYAEGDLGRFAMSEQEGLQVLDHLLVQDGPEHLVISTRALEPRLRQWVDQNEGVDATAPDEPTAPGHPAEAGTSTLQAIVCTVYQQVLGVSEVGADDNFFDLGGDSLLAAQILANLRRALKEAGLAVDARTLQLRDVFSYPSVGELTAHLESGPDEGEEVLNLRTALLGWAAGLRAGRAESAGVHGERDALAIRVRELAEDREEKADLSLVLAPLSSSLARVERQVETLEKERAHQLGQLSTRLDAMHTAGEALRSSTESLLGALRSPNVRGAWGEVQLKRVVEYAGMLARVDFDTQVSGTNDKGDQVRPDAVVTLPGGKYVVIDAKAPMTAFLEALGSPGPPPEQALTAHARALRRHVDALAGKRYWSAFQPGPDVVVCFVPGESFLAAACEADTGLLEHAMAAGVVIATPTTLLALLRTVAVTWQHDALTGNARDLLDVAQELYRRLGGLGTQVGKLGSALERAVTEYNATIGTLEKRVLVSARRMQHLGIDSSPAVHQPPGIHTRPRPFTAPELRPETPVHDGADPPVPADGPQVSP